MPDWAEPAMKPRLQPNAMSLDKLQGASAADLRRLWIEIHTSPPPATLSGRLLRLALAWEVQNAGQRNSKSQRDWNVVIERRAVGAGPDEALTGLKPPAVPVGTRLMRTWGGETHEVVVLAEGVLWRGRTWSSLSVVARAITGARRNGPRFFGLRSGGT